MDIENKVVTLPDLPKGKEFEEFISAYLHSDGYYLDRNIIDRSIEELLEVDIIITNYDQLPRPSLIEIKSGEWGFSEVFKIKGWMTYTEINKGYFIVQNGKKNFDFYSKKAKELKVGLYAVPDLLKTEDYLRPLLKKKSIDKRDVEILRYSFWIERVMLQRLKKFKKSDKSKKCYEALEQYYFNINSGIFFTPNIIDRISLLYSNFKNNARITAKCANELDGLDFEDNHVSIPKKHFINTFYRCDFNIIQISTLLEYLSRIAILKNAIDYLMLRNTKLKRKVEIKIQYFAGITKLDFLPFNFNIGIDKISTHKNYNRYAVFWQWFLYVFGGFILLDIKDKEYKLLSEKTGIEINEIENALSSMDLLFPTNGSWLRLNQKTNIFEAIFFPMPFRGMGANYRLEMYGNKDEKLKDFGEIGLKNKYAIDDLVKWNNLSVEILYNN
jgi:hypothetical protein